MTVPAVDDLARRAGVTEQIAAKRLEQLVDAGLLAKQPYREPGRVRAMNTCSPSAVVISIRYWSV